MSNQQPTANPLYNPDKAAQAVMTPNPIGAPVPVAAATVNPTGPPEGNKEEYEEIREQVSYPDYMVYFRRFKHC